MKTIPFHKYHGTGNDFILIDNRSGQYNSISSGQVAAWCHRRFGIGADGLILLEPSGVNDFRMKYYNSDGNENSMCGNGGRCITAFANHLGITGNTCSFDAIDGYHEAKMIRTGNPAYVSLKMKDVDEITEENGAFIINTGSPHYVIFCNDADKIDLIQEAKSIRYSERFRKEGINVNFVSPHNGNFKIRTYERGVEDETYSCGTGTVAAALAVTHSKRQLNEEPVKFTAPGGKLEVSFKKHNEKFSDIWLTGEVAKVFEGNLSL